MNRHHNPLTLLIADDHQIILDGLSTILETEKSIGTILTASNGQEAVDLATTGDVDCVVMDINMPLLNGLEATKQIKAAKPAVKIVVMSMLCDASIVSKLLKAGASGFVNKESGKDELLRAIAKVTSGENYVSPDISFNLYAHLLDRGVSTSGEKSLTPKELEIVRHIADGLTNKEIASLLFLSTATVDTHRKNMLAKLQLKNTAALVRYAAEHRLLDL